MNLQNSINLYHHLNGLSRSRVPSPLKDIVKYMNEPGMISLAGGLPHPSAFPYSAMQLQIYSPEADVATVSSKSSALLDISVGKYPSLHHPNNLSTALQYSVSTGSKSLSAFLYNFVQRVLRPAYSDFEVLLHFGNTDAWNKVVNLLCEPGDYILVEEYTYPSAQAVWAPMGCCGVPIPLDKDGILPEALERVLSDWEQVHPGVRRPHLLYVVPTGQNPTGSTLPLERKKEIYSICVKYDVIICEDDPYYFLQMPDYVPPSERDSEGIAKSERVTDDSLVDKLVPTFVSLDYQGRVIRLDTFSKTMGPGHRLGYFVCNPLFSERLLRASEVTTQAPGGWSQAIIEEHLTAWKHEGLLRWFNNLRNIYTIRRDWLCDLIFSVFDVRPSSDGIADDYIVFPKGYGSDQDTGKRHMFSFNAPKGGMFLWIKLNLTSNSNYRTLKASGEGDPEGTLETKIWMEMIQEKAL
ncbi:hypothetical protein VKT23_012413 [Stygiomarasmius scandens]|uniref:Aminotransferase class I/classII large domain-containing protein n=1 Tax=Marasmiellus scandens TaxID=2682957 RepID=A0ABR1J6R6_9AGAR